MSFIIRSRTQTSLVSSMLLPDKPKQTYKFKTKNQPLFQNSAHLNCSNAAVRHKHTTHMSFSIKWVWPLHDGKAWRWHSKTRSARIASDRDTVSVCGVSVCVAKGFSKLHNSWSRDHSTTSNESIPASDSMSFNGDFSSRRHLTIAWVLFHLVELSEISAVGTVLLCGLPRCFIFVFLFLIVLVFVRFARCNFYFYIVFVSQIVIILVFVLVERSTIILVFVFVFVTKIALVCVCAHDLCY